MRSPTWISLLALTLLVPSTAFADMMAASPCNCDDDCTYHGWGGPYCEFDYHGSAYCGWNGPGTPCPDGGSPPDLMPPPLPDMRPPPIGPDLSREVTDAGVSPPGDGGPNQLMDRGGCSVAPAGSPVHVPVVLLLLGLVGLVRRSTRR